MIDTSATHTLITRSLLETFPHPPIQTISTTTTILHDTYTMISVYGMVSLRIYIYQSYFHTYFCLCIESLGVDPILSMDWCRTYNVILSIHQQELLLHHPQYSQTTVRFQDTIFVPVRLAKSIQLAPYHQHIILLITPLSSASQISYTPDTNLCNQMNIFIPDAILYVRYFRTFILTSNLVIARCTLRRGTILGHITFFSTFPAPVKLASFSCSLPFSLLNSPLITASSIKPKPTPDPSDIDSIIQNLVHLITDPEEEQTFSTILQPCCNVFDVSKPNIAKT